MLILLPFSGLFYYFLSTFLMTSTKQKFFFNVVQFINLFMMNAFCDSLKKSLPIPRSRINSSYLTETLLIYLSHLGLRATWKYLFYLV